MQAGAPKHRLWLTPQKIKIQDLSEWVGGCAGWADGWPCSPCRRLLQDGKTALHSAADNGHVAVVEAMLASGAALVAEDKVCTLTCRLTQFCNRAVAGSTSAELLASFCDNLLKKGGSEKLTDEAIEDVLEKVRPTVLRFRN